MKIKTLVVLLVLVSVRVDARAQRLPVIDMHLHAYATDENGPPPLGLCVPLMPHPPPLDPNKTDFKAVAKVFSSRK